MTSHHIDLLTIDPFAWKQNVQNSTKNWKHLIYDIRGLHQPNTNKNI